MNRKTLYFDCFTAHPLHNHMLMPIFDERDTQAKSAMLNINNLQIFNCFLSQPSIVHILHNLVNAFDDFHSLDYVKLEFEREQSSIYMRVGNTRFTLRIS